VKYLASLNQSLGRLLAEDSRVVVFGEDILDPYGGAFKVTRGLQEQHPDRVLTTPISEAALVALANGMALRGLRPVVEIMFGDFLSLCMDQILNHATKFRAMYNGQVTVPITVRTPMGGGRGYGPTHSQSIEKLFLGVPYLDVISPSVFGDAGELLERAVRRDCPVLFIEHKLLYPAELISGNSDGMTITSQSDSAAFPVFRVQNYETGNPDVTLITYGGMGRFVPEILRHLAKEELRVLACVPTRISPLPCDILTEAACESGRVVVLEEGTLTNGWGAEIAAQLQESAWGELKRPVRRIAAPDSIVPTARQLEDAFLPSASLVEAEILEMIE